jgi:hypothetical protein
LLDAGVAVNDLAGIANCPVFVLYVFPQVEVRGHAEGQAEWDVPVSADIQAEQVAEWRAAYTHSGHSVSD